jgi:hypothetical protein
MVEAVATVWTRLPARCDGCPTRSLPALQAGLALAWPDTFRVRIRSAFGTALDLGLAGDSIVAYAPAQGCGVMLDAVRDSLGPGPAGSLVVRALSAGWQPPDSAWTRVTRVGDLLVLRWSEGADSVALAVDAADAPAWARLWRAGGQGVQVDYDRWGMHGGVAWPLTLRLRDLEGAFELVLRVDRVGFASRPDRSRLAVRLPDGAERLRLDQLRGLFERLGYAR